MDNVIKTLGIIFALIAVVYFLKPNVLKRIMQFFKKGKRLYLPVLLRFALAIVFLVGARECKRFWVIFVLGVLFLISGLLAFVLGLEKLKSMIDWYQKQSNILLRILALITLAVGAIIIYSV